MKYFFLKYQSAIFPVWVINLVNVLYNLLAYSDNLKKNRVLVKDYESAIGIEDFRYFKKFAYHEVDHIKYKDYLFAYANSQLKLLKGSVKILDKVSDPILICAAKNDLLKIKHQYNTMKSYGVKSFVYIDNGSTDGTKEYLLKKSDVILYQTHQTYNSVVRSAWVRKIIQEIGFNRWYLLLDSDEIYAYPNIEVDRFNSFLKELVQKKHYYVQSVMVDMYPKNSIPISSSSNHTEASNLSNYCWFDKNYKKTYSRITPVIKGGPRHRLFSDANYEFSSWLNKVNLIYYKKYNFHYSHILLPYVYNHKAKTLAATLHYKFLPVDFAKYKSIADEGNYANNSKEYKRYVEVFKNLSSINFYHSNSIKFEDSSSLLKINVIEKTV